MLEPPQFRALPAIVNNSRCITRLPPSLPILRIDDDRYGAVVGKAYLHHGAKLPGLDGLAEVLRYLTDEVIV